MNNMTIIYYTANLISDIFASNIRRHLLRTIGDKYSIISISQKPIIDFGENICVGEIGVSGYNIYKQILLGSKMAKTEFIVCCEDDSLYIPEHFQYLPSKDTFAYNINRWNVNRRFYFYRARQGMCMCVAPTELMIKTLEIRFSKFGEEWSKQKQIQYFGEPGRYERKLGLPPVKIESFRTELPTLTFNHRPSYGGVRALLSTDLIAEELPFWGNANNLWNNMMYGNGEIREK